MEQKLEWRDVGSMYHLIIIYRYLYYQDMVFNVRTN